MAIEGNIFRAALLSLAIGGISLNANAGAITVYSNDFNSGASAQMSGAGRLDSVAGFAGIGNAGNQFSGQYLVNDTGTVWKNPNPVPATPTVVTLTGLPDHTAISLSFLLAIRDSWDGSYYAPDPTYDFANYDYFNVAVDGVKVFSETFGLRNTLGAAYGYTGYVQSYVPPVGGLLTGTGLNAKNYGGGPSADSAYDMGVDPSFQSIAHSGSTLTLSFWADGPGWQGMSNGILGNCKVDACSDESWGMDNLHVSVIQAVPVQPVPEPQTYAMMLVGLGLLGVTARRRKDIQQ
jgi:hypothetical protein